MQARIIWVICVAVTAVCTGCSANQSGLAVLGGDPVEYRCDEGGRIVARYYALSDDSLKFVKLVMPDGKKYTLPVSLSASGARYTDDVEKVWWTKGDSAFVQSRDQDGGWQTGYRCREHHEE